MGLSFCTYDKTHFFRLNNLDGKYHLRIVDTREHRDITEGGKATVFGECTGTKHQLVGHPPTYKLPECTTDETVDESGKTVKITTVTNYIGTAPFGAIISTTYGEGYRLVTASKIRGQGTIPVNPISIMDLPTSKKGSHYANLTGKKQREPQPARWVPMEFLANLINITTRALVEQHYLFTDLIKPELHVVFADDQADINHQEVNIFVFNHNTPGAMDVLFDKLKHEPSRGWIRASFAETILSLHELGVDTTAFKP